jgi:LPS sulfotransferase NodH
MDAKILTFTTTWAPEFDGPDGLLKTSLLIFGTPRTGSQTICRLLHEVGLGVPAEYFLPRIIKQYCERFRVGLPPDAASFMKDYVQAIRERRCLNGVLSCKMQPDQHRKLTDSLGYAWEDTLPGLSVIRLRRRDHVGQVVSLGAALQTGIWDDFSPQLSRKFAGLSDLAARRWTDAIFLSDLYWERHLEDRKLRIIDFYWEDLASPEKLEKLLQSVGVDRSRSEIRDMMGKWPRYSCNQPLIHDISQRFGTLIARRWEQLSINPSLAENIILSLAR